MRGEEAGIDGRTHNGHARKGTGIETKGRLCRDGWGPPARPRLPHCFLLVAEMTIRATGHCQGRGAAADLFLLHLEAHEGLAETLYLAHEGVILRIGRW